MNEGKIITVQDKEHVVKLLPQNNCDIIKIGKAVAEFHTLLLNMNLGDIDKSNFYRDFMENKIRLHQPTERLKEIEEFYARYTPDYDILTSGVVHNDLNSNNIFKVEEKYFFIDFEFLRRSPLISDLGVLILELWDYKMWVQDYLDKLAELLKGYEMKFILSEYDKKNIINFSLRYLFSDENWYNFWSYNGKPNAKYLIPEIIEKQNILLESLR